MLDLFEEFKKIIISLDGSGLEYALCGGLALAVYAAPRATVDIDLLIEPASLDKIKGILRNCGYTVEGNPMRFGSHTIIHRMSRIDETDGDLLSVDLILVTEANQKAWSGRKTVAWEKNELSIVSRDGLVLLKTLRNSAQDRIDIENMNANEAGD